MKSCDYPMEIAGRVFEMLNFEKVKFVWTPGSYMYISTDEEPKNLVYPEGWYYAKGMFRNKHNSTNGEYSEIPMVTSNGFDWGDSARYCTMYD